jgi:endonuclease/exonuclease/phosphatase (EEP) superfamily protein YafD
MYNGNMSISILTYNVLFNKAIPQLLEIVNVNKPDIICLQEIDTSEENLNTIKLDGYKLADYSNSFIQFGKIYGLAIYYNTDTLIFTNSEDLDLSKSFFENFLSIIRVGKSQRSVLKTEFKTIKDTSKINVYTAHCSTWGSNGARNKQIMKIFSDLKNDSQEPILVAGDFNYPYGRKKLESIAESFGFREATKNLLYTVEYKLFKLIPIKWKLDYIFYRNLELIETKRIKAKYSDHYPIISFFNY